jgi:1-acyl-sn-glycerol-3-phosphate acyltransferase
MLNKLRFVARLPGFFAMVVLLIPTLIGIACGGALKTRAIALWSGWFLRAIGFSLKSVGTPYPQAALFVANHATWMDIQVLHARRLLSFVAKAEIAGWPVLGWLASRADTIYHQRGNTDSLAKVMAEMTERLRQGAAVAVFPEGGTNDGLSLKAFHARVFQVAMDADVPVQPVAIQFTRNGALCSDASFRGNESFFGNLLRIMGEPGQLITVHFLPIQQDFSAGRRAVSNQARLAIAEVLGVPTATRSRRDTAAADSDASDD